MKNIGTSLFAGILVAFGGLLVSEFMGSIFNGMEYGSACVLGVCLYLCVVVVTCTGIIVSKLDKNALSAAHAEEKDDTQNDG